ncbi:MAG TPA: glycosyltransferase family 1 protein [Acidimicrobiales bacterium]|nr:glycosyltransferase family 1 protein [Acidimicrobiales bacterium]
MSGPSLRLSLDVSAVPDRPVGAGRYTIDLATALLARDDVTPTLWSRRGDAARWRAMTGAGGAGAHVEAVAPERRPLRLAWEQARLPGLLRRADVAVHHGPHYTMPERARLPRVVTVHDLTFFEHPEWHERSKVVVFRRAIRVAARRADAIVCVSARTAERLEALCSPTGRVFVVPHGVDHDRFRPDPGAADADGRILEGLGVHPPYVVFVGTLEPRKAVPDLVAAFDMVAGASSELSLVLAGQPGWGAAAVERAVAAARAGGRVVRTGYVPDDAVPALLRQAVAAAYPALEEGFGLPALEALACGTPLVTTAGTTMAELSAGAAFEVRPGSVGQLADALRAVAGGDDAVAERRRLGLAVAAGHTWTACAAGHMAAYRWAVGGHPGSPPGPPPRPPPGPPPGGSAAPR